MVGKGGQCGEGGEVSKHTPTAPILTLTAVTVPPAQSRRCTAIRGTYEHLAVRAHQGWLGLCLQMQHQHSRTWSSACLPLSSTQQFLRAVAYRYRSQSQATSRRFLPEQRGVPDNTLWWLDTEGFPTPVSNSLWPCAVSAKGDLDGSLTLTYTYAVKRWWSNFSNELLLNLCVATRTEVCQGKQTCEKGSHGEPTGHPGGPWGTLGDHDQGLRGQTLPRKRKGLWQSVGLARVMDPTVGDRWVSKAKGSHQSGLPTGRQGQGAWLWDHPCWGSEPRGFQIGSHGPRKLWCTRSREEEANVQFCANALFSSSIWVIVWYDNPRC